MSTRQIWEFDLAGLAAQRAAAEASRRSLELARLKTERAGALHREKMAIAREHERLRSSMLRAQAGALNQSQAELGRLNERARAAGVRLDHLDSQLQTSRLELERAGAELRAEVSRLSGLECAVREQEAAVSATLAEAGRTLEHVERLAAAGAENLSALADEADAGRAFSTRQSELEGQIRQLESEVRFVAQQAMLTPVALVTLEAMRENGYRLRDTVSRDGLVVYFEKEGAEHQIAVRMATIPPAAEASSSRWDLLAETFGLKGEACLGELDDFETAIAEKGHLKRVGGRVYPRDDRQAVLPKPRLRRQASSWAGAETKREKA